MTKYRVNAQCDKQNGFPQVVIEYYGYGPRFQGNDVEDWFFFDGPFDNEYLAKRSVADLQGRFMSEIVVLKWL